MRILMTADSVGGVWTYALELTRALQPYGVEVLLAVMGPPLSDAQSAAARSITNLNLFKSNYKLEWMPDCWSDVKHAGDWLLHLENRLQPDLIHLNGYAHASLSWNSPTLVTGHSCVCSWWQAVKADAPPAEWQRYKTEVTNGLSAAAPAQEVNPANDIFVGEVDPRVRRRPRPATATRTRSPPIDRYFLLHPTDGRRT